MVHSGRVALSLVAISVLALILQLLPWLRYLLGSYLTTPSTGRVLQTRLIWFKACKLSLQIMYPPAFVLVQVRQCPRKMWAL